MNLSDIDIVILCGGQGTRIRDYLPPGLPKCMADINGRPFIEILLDKLFDAGFRCAILCVAYGASKIVDLFAAEKYDGAYFPKGNGEQFHLEFTYDDRIGIGTGGAIAAAVSEEISDPFLIINGDTICDIDFDALLENHREVDFAATIPHDSQYRNIGIYIFTKKAIKRAAERLGMKFDLDDAVGILSNIGMMVNWQPVDANFYDIGTPEGLESLRCANREMAVAG